jgi:antagonist of KipI
LQQGARCYLAVHGGFCVERWLGSYSTNLKAGFKRLEKGDELLFKENRLYVAGLLTEGEDFKVLRWQVATGHVYEHPNEIFFIKGNEWDQLSALSQQDFLENNFTIHPFSDRMGYQLKGVDLQRTVDTEIISSGVHFGTIQLLPNGQLIILMADHQTTGGYPRLGHVVSAHLPKLSQLRPSDCIQFKETDIGTAEAMLLAQQQELNILHRACFEKLQQLYARG